MSKRFSKEVIKKLKYYVYLYSDPDTNEIFYVGKGKGNRVFTHLKGDKNEKNIEKSKAIQRILDGGKEPKIEILIHGLEDEKTALRVETAVIDLIGKGNLTNKIRGWESGIFGRTEVNQLILHYEQEQVTIDEPGILIRINQLFRYDMTEIELYDATRGIWVIGPNREKVKYAFAVYDTIIQEVYKVIAWFPAGTTFNTRGTLDYKKDERWEFVGQKAEAPIRSKYIGKSVEHYFPNYARNPIYYVNIKQ